MARAVWGGGEWEYTWDLRHIISLDAPAHKKMGLSAVKLSLSNTYRLCLDGKVICINTFDGQKHER